MATEPMANEFMAAQQQLQLDLETLRGNNQLVLETKRAKLEAIRLAKEVLIENARSKPVDSRDVSASDITNFANVLINYVNS